MNRHAIFWLALFGGLALSVVLSITLGGLWLIVALPFFLFAGGFLGPRGRPARSTGRAVRHCPSCGYRARGADERFCPRDGAHLREAEP